MGMGDIFLSSLLLLMAFGETATHENCPLAGTIHWKNSRCQYKNSCSVNTSQLASRNRTASTSLDTPSFSIPRPICCTSCLHWPRRWAGLWVCEKSPLGSGVCSLMAKRVLCWRENGDRGRVWDRMFVKKTLVKLRLSCYKSIVLCSFGKAGASWVPNGNQN